MPPDAAVAVLYGISKDPVVMAFLQSQPAATRDKINLVIDNLQFDPKPQGHIPAVSTGFPIIKVIIETTNPNYYLIYTVDDNKEKVFVIAIQEKRFS